MRIKLLVLAALAAAVLGGSGARADYTEQCTTDLPTTACAFLFQEDEGDHRGVIAGISSYDESSGLYVFAGREEHVPTNRAATGACASYFDSHYALSQCAVLFQEEEGNYFAVYGSNANCVVDPDAGSPVSC